MRSILSIALLAFTALVQPACSTVLAPPTSNPSLSTITKPFTSLRRLFVASEDGTKIYAEAIGDKRNTPVVFIHGFGGSVVHFNKQFEDAKLLKNLYLIRYDMRGHGRSEGPLEAGAYESIRHAQDLKAVLDGFDAVRPFVAGWSLGGFIPADAVAAYGPSFISGVILLGSGIGPDDNFLSIIARPTVAELLTGLASTDVLEFRNATMAFSKSLYAPGYEIAFEEEQRVVGGLLIMHPAVRAHTGARSVPGGPITAAADKLPFLVIGGSEDAHIDAEIVRDYMTENRFKIEFHLLDGIGHSVFYEAPEKTDNLILQFVKKHASNKV